jgi:hypothetical protein
MDGFFESRSYHNQLKTRQFAKIEDTSVLAVIWSTRKYYQQWSVRTKKGPVSEKGKKNHPYPAVSFGKVACDAIYDFCRNSNYVLVHKEGMVTCT